MTSINILFLFEIRRNGLGIGWSQSLYISIRRAIKQIVVIRGAYRYIQNFIQYSAVKVDSICRRNYRDHQGGV